MRIDYDKGRGEKQQKRPTKTQDGKQAQQKTEHDREVFVVGNTSQELQKLLLLVFLVTQRKEEERGLALDSPSAGGRHAG